MIKLKSPLNYRGTLIEAGAIVGFLPVELQEKLIKSGVAEKAIQEKAKEEKPEKPVDKMTKAELLELAANLRLSDISEEMTKAEILEAIATAQKGEQESPGEDDDNGTQGSDTN